MQLSNLLIEIIGFLNTFLLRPNHDALGQAMYDDQLDALRIDDEDWKNGFSFAYGAACTNETFLFGLDFTTSREYSMELSAWVRQPLAITAETGCTGSIRAFGNFRSPVSLPSSPHLRDLTEKFRD